MMQDNTKQNLDKKINEIMKAIKNSLQRETPIRSGRLRRRWRIQGNAVVNDTPYARYVIDDDLIERAIRRIR